MALVFCDSFDHYAIGDLSAKYTSITNTSGSFAAGRNGNGLLMDSPGNCDYVKTISGMGSTAVSAGLAFKMVGLVDQGHIALREGATTHITLMVNASGGFTVKRGTSGGGATIATSANGLWSANNWYYVEIGTTIHDSAGTVEVRLNGVTVINAGTLDTKNGGAGTIDTIQLGDVALASTTDTTIDDVYFSDTLEFYGDVRVEALFPSGNGNTSDWSGSDGNSTDNYALVDEAAPSSADYVDGGQVGYKDTYVFGNLVTTSGTVRGLQLLPHARKTASQTRSIVSVARLSGTEADGPSKTLSAGSDVYYPDIRSTKPGGGSWTISNVNDAEFGMKVDS